MTQVILEHEPPVSLMAILAELRSLGLKTNDDFDFAYVPPNWADGVLHPRHTIFYFHSDSFASWFVLKYCR